MDWVPSGAEPRKAVTIRPWVGWALWERLPRGALVEDLLELRGSWIGLIHPAGEYLLDMMVAGC
jgi:hypothetical protein